MRQPVKCAACKDTGFIREQRMTGKGVEILVECCPECNPPENQLDPNLADRKAAYDAAFKTRQGEGNGLTPAEAERLACLAEEAAEVIQAVTKILRHGYESKYRPEEGGLSNREQLDMEITDFRAIARMMFEKGDVGAAPLQILQQRIIKKRKWMHHQNTEGN